MAAIWRKGVAVILVALCACGPDGDDENADPILGAWDEPATNGGLEFFGGGRLVDLMSPGVAASWERNSPGVYALEIGSRDAKREPFRTTAKLDGDLLRFDTEHVICLRRRTWTLEDPGPRAVEMEGKLVAIMSGPTRGARMVRSGHYLKDENGDLTAIEPQAGMELVRFDKTAFRSKDGRFPMQLGKRYRVHGIAFTIDEVIAEMKRLGHGPVSITRPQGCDVFVDVYRMVELEKVGRVGSADNSSNSSPGARAGD